MIELIFYRLFAVLMENIVVLRELHVIYLPENVTVEI